MKKFVFNFDVLDMTNEQGEHYLICLQTGDACSMFKTLEIGIEHLTTITKQKIQQAIYDESENVPNSIIAIHLFEEVSPKYLYYYYKQPNGTIIEVENNDDYELNFEIRGMSIP